MEARDFLPETCNLFESMIAIVLGSRRLLGDRVFSICDLIGRAVFHRRYSTDRRYSAARVRSGR